MSLDFTLRTPDSTRLEGLKQRYPSVDIDPEYYEVLRPCFEAIHIKTGKFIDLYAWKEFSGDELQILVEVFEEKKKEVDATLSPVVVNLGQERNPDGSKTDLIYSLNPESISLLLQRSLDLIGVAQVDGKIFVCKGD